MPIYLRRWLIWWLVLSCFIFYKQTYIGHYESGGKLLTKDIQNCLFTCKLFSKNMVACLYHKQRLLQAVSKQRCCLNTTDSYFKLRTRSSALYMESYTWKRSPYIEIRVWFVGWTLQWHHNEHYGISNHQPHDCLLNRLFKAHQRKDQSSASLVFVQGISWRPVNSPHKGPVTR